MTGECATKEAIDNKKLRVEMRKFHEWNGDFIISSLFFLLSLFFFYIKTAMITITKSRKNNSFLLHTHSHQPNYDYTAFNVTYYSFSLGIGIYFVHRHEYDMTKWIKYKYIAYKIYRWWHSFQHYNAI